MAQLIAATALTATSADFTLADGESTVISLFDADGGVSSGAADIQLKASNGTYTTVPDGRLAGNYSAARVLGPGTFRVMKESSPVATGVDRS